MTPVERLLGRLDRVKRSGRGWVARCPVHADRAPSLSVSEGREGKALVYCHAGCSVDEIVAAVGLSVGDLFAEETISRIPPRIRVQGCKGRRRWVH